MPEYDLAINLNNYLGDDPTYNPYLSAEYGSYADISSLATQYNSLDSPLFLSLNVQSLNSKFNALKDLINHLIMNNSNIAVIAIQEVWNVPYPDLLKINGFQLFLKQRQTGRGGGWDFTFEKDVPPK